MGLLKANHFFFLLHLLHILLLDVAAWFTLWIFGTSFVPFLLCAVLLSTVQVRASGWSCAILGIPQKSFVHLRRPRLLPADLKIFRRVCTERAHTFKFQCLWLLAAH
jgi:hypothetical protein